MVTPFHGPFPHFSFPFSSEQVGAPLSTTTPPSWHIKSAGPGSSSPIEARQGSPARRTYPTPRLQLLGQSTFPVVRDLHEDQAPYPAPVWKRRYFYYGLNLDGQSQVSLLWSQVPWSECAIAVMCVLVLWWDSQGFSKLASCEVRFTLHLTPSDWWGINFPFRLACCRDLWSFVILLSPSQLWSGAHYGAGSKGLVQQPN